MVSKSSLVLSFLLLLLLAACSPNVQAAQITPALDPAVTPTDCGCSAEGPNKLKATDAFGGPAGPAAPGQENTSPPAGNAEVSAGWEIFTSPDGAFSFEYPAAYATQKYGFCAARTNPNPPSGANIALSLGSRTELSVSVAPASLEAALKAFRDDPARKDYQFDMARERMVAGIPAQTLSYRSGGTNRYAESTFFIRDGLLYRVDTGAPSACDVPDLNLTELDAYSHLLDTFQFR